MRTEALDWVRSRGGSGIVCGNREAEPTFSLRVEFGVAGLNKPQRDLLSYSNKFDFFLLPLGIRTEALGWVRSGGRTFAKRWMVRNYGRIAKALSFFPRKWSSIKISR